MPLAFRITEKVASAENSFRVSKHAAMIAERAIPPRQWTATRFRLYRRLFRRKNTLLLLIVKRRTVEQETA